MSSRREFLRTTAVAGGALLGAGPLLACASSLARSSASSARPPAKQLDMLVLGGTGFIGPHLVRYAMARGHRVTIFTRGRRDADLPPGVERLIGDRNGKLEALAGRRWDVVVDDSATNPEWVRLSTAMLKDNVGRYLFTSSTGVYYPYLTRGLDERTPVRLEADDPNDGSAAFGVAKARCEKVVLDTFGERGVVVRPTYIVGPGDTTDRFPYWPQRLAKGGEVLAPGRRDDPVQLIDVRDLAELMVTLLEDGRSGIYDAVGPAAPLTMHSFLEQARDALDAKVTFTWVDDYDFLEAHKIGEAIPWAMLKGNDYGMMSVRGDRARAAGLRYRPLATTVRDTLAWWPSVPEKRRASPRFAITPEQEAQALADWHARVG